VIFPLFFQVHDIERLITYVRFPSLFQHLLTFIRTWAQNIGIYGQVYGYLGGYSWAILCAYICHKYIPSNQSLFSLEQFFMLVEKFFSTYSQFNWSNASLSLYPNHSSSDRRGSMRILCPSPPFNNSSRSTINSTRYLIIQAFRNASGKTCEDILRFKNRFPDQTIQSVFQLTLSGQTLNELNQWIGYMKSRLAHFLTDCEDECDLFVQTDHQIESREKPLERFYSLGFQVNEQILSRHRQFYYCLNKFLDQFKTWTFRSDTMKISYKLMSRNQWDSEHKY
jgi:poly(A) polymerase Pap1